MMWDWMAMPQVVQGLVSCYCERASGHFAIRRRHRHRHRGSSVNSTPAIPEEAKIKIRFND